MKNKMIPLGMTFSSNEKVVSECDDQTLGFTTEMLVIQFDQERIGQLLFMGNTSPLCVHKHMKILMGKASLANS